MKKQINVVGIGPGHPDWMTPIARRILSESDVVIGGRRQLTEISGFVKETRLLEGNYSETTDWIINQNPSMKIAVAVSGDTGFHSLLGYLKKHLPDVEIHAIPGIGSLQYFFGRLGLGWEKAVFLSAHGRELNLEQFDENTLAGILTDTVMTPGAIAAELVLQEKDNLWMAVGENLSYENETITIGTTGAIQQMLFDPLNAVIILPAELAGKLRKDGVHGQ